MSMTLFITKVYGKDSKRKGEEYEEAIGYFTDIISVFDKLVAHRMMASDARDLRTLIGTVTDIKLLIKESLNIHLDKSIHLDKEIIDVAKAASNISTVCETIKEKAVRTERVRA
jgi:hypothetical protein